MRAMLVALLAMVTVTTACRPGACFDRPARVAARSTSAADLPSVLRHLLLGVRRSRDKSQRPEPH